MQNRKDVVKGMGEAMLKGPANLLREDISLPAVVLYQSRLQNNLHWMRDFAAHYQVALAPHGKTTMAPALFARQLQAGAWGITLATAVQCVHAWQHGVRRILMANQLVGRQNMLIISRLLTNPDTDFYCLLDCEENLQQLEQFFTAQQQQIKVLIEVGIAGGRCGLRTREAVIALAEKVQQCHAVKLAGIETYEGVIHGEDAVAQVNAHLLRVKDMCQTLITRGLFHTDSVILSGAGSAWYDLVAERFAEDLPASILPVIRPGCYLVHDHGLCDCGQQKIMARSSVARAMGYDLQSAMEIWAYVQSIPEPGVAVIGMGKRDVAFDAGLPLPLLHYRPGEEAPLAIQEEWQVASMMDQHAKLVFPAGSDLRVGDMIAFGTSHPCLTFDKWRRMNVISDRYDVVEEIETFFQ
ncbi:amino acid deaminase [Cellvibrio polysaccharolyticus]|nr:amino acid deaminase [Cellvibrio polysaccharolyticus]